MRSATRTKLRHVDFSDTDKAYSCLCSGFLELARDCNMSQALAGRAPSILVPRLA